MKNFSVLVAMCMLMALSGGALVVQGHDGDDHDTDEESPVRIQAEGSATVSAQDEDSDDDGVSDDSEEEREMNDSDTDADGHADVRTESDSDGRAQNHNSSRSNETEGVVDPHDEDDDGDGVPTRTGVTKELDKATPSLRATKEIDAASPKLMDVLMIDQSSPLLYQGVSIRQVCGSDDCDDEDSVESLTRSNISLRVSGAEVRGWNPEQKEAVRARLAAANEVNSANDFGIKVASAAIENEEVEDIATDAEATEVTYNSRVYLFGFIPKSVTAVARAEADGDVSVDYPWYGFLSRKGDQSFGSTLAATIRADHDAMISVEEEGVERTVRDEGEEN
ncbi:MAG: hypothetical protein WDZ82_01675 [Candidatus Paceibacterota bacterium]